MRFVALPSLLLLLASGVLAAADDDRYRVDWHIALEAGNDLAEVTVTIEDGGAVSEIGMIFDDERLTGFEGTGTLTPTRSGMNWEPPAEGARLTYQARVTRARDNKNQDESYDALMTDTWALFRGDRLTPRMRVTARKDAESESVLSFSLPQGWATNTGWPLYKEDSSTESYLVDDPERSFDRPSGWIMVGRLGSRRDYVGSTYFSIVAPLNSNTDRMSWLTLVSLVYPELEAAFQTVPQKLLMVSGDDPLWRGGLSGPNSFFFHSSRRAVSENGTSPLFHELTHVVTRISGQDRDDWIAEGLAEFYGIELVHRAGGMSDDKRREVMASLAQWGEEADKLRVRQSTGAVTARAVGVFDALDREIGRLTDDEANLDAVARLLMRKRRVGLEDLVEAFEEVTGSTSAILDDIE